MTTQALGVAYSFFDKLIIGKLAQMDSRHLDLATWGQAQKTSGSKSKRADISYCPMDPLPNRDPKWPTVAIESGYSQSKSKLAGDACWWLTESGGDVRTALTVSIHQTKKEIVIERWGLINRPTRTDTEKMVPEVVQKIVISQLTDDQPVRVTDAPLVIPFDHFFLRPANQDEGNIVFSEDELIYIANAVWSVHENV